MALSDYKLCDKCGSKAFYDAKLNYREKPILERQTRLEDEGLYLDFLGDWKVLCVDCSNSFECVIQAKPLVAAKNEYQEGESK